MNEPIISPWVFYLLGLLEPIRTMAAISIFLSGLITVFAYTAYDENKDYDDSKARGCLKASKIALLFFVMSILVLLSVPTTSTAYKMLIASYVTPENINAGIQITKDGVQFIMQTIIDTAKQVQGL